MYTMCGIIRTKTVMTTCVANNIVNIRYFNFPHVYLKINNKQRGWTSTMETRYPHEKFDAQIETQLLFFV